MVDYTLFIYLSTIFIQNQLLKKKTTHLIKKKIAYYKALELAQTAENYGPLELFVAEAILFSNELLTS